MPKSGLPGSADDTVCGVVEGMIAPAIVEEVSGVRIRKELTLSPLRRPLIGAVITSLVEHCGCFPTSFIITVKFLAT